MDRTYTTADFWAWFEVTYQEHVRDRWEWARGYLHTNGRAYTSGNAEFMAYHLLHWRHSRDHEDAERAARIQELLLAETNLHTETGLFRQALDDPSSPELWSVNDAMIPLALAVRLGRELGRDWAQQEHLKGRFLAYCEAASRYVDREENRHGNQMIGFEMAGLGFAYWATGDRRFVRRAEELALKIDFIYQKEDPENYAPAPGLFPDWTWNHTQHDPLANGGATHSPTYENAQLCHQLMGYRMFRLAGVELPGWLEFYRKLSRASILGNLSARGMSPYAIEAYDPAQRYQPMSQFHVGCSAGWASSLPEVLEDPSWKGIARFLFDRSMESLGAPSAEVQRTFYRLSEGYPLETAPDEVSTAQYRLYYGSLLASFADLDAVKPEIRRYWDWRWTWDLLHVRGDDYDAHLAGWTNRKPMNRRYEPLGDWVHVDPCFVGGSICRLFTSAGVEVFPFAVKEFAWRVDTDFQVLDSAEACMGRRGAGYDFQLDVDGRRLDRPQDFATPAWPTDFKKILCRWKVTFRDAGDMVVENAFFPDRIEVVNRFVPSKSVNVRQTVQPLPFTRHFGKIAWRKMGSDREEEFTLDWSKDVVRLVRRVPLVDVEELTLAGAEIDRLTILPGAGCTDFVINAGRITERWPDGWNWIALIERVGRVVCEPLEQNYTIRMTRPG